MDKFTVLAIELLCISAIFGVLAKSVFVFFFVLEMGIVMGAFCVLLFYIANTIK